MFCYEYGVFYYWVQCLFLTKNVILFRRPLYKQEIILKKDYQISIIIFIIIISSSSSSSSSISSSIVEILCYEYELFYYWVKCLFLTKNVILFRRPLYKQEIILKKDYQISIIIFIIISSSSSSSSSSISSSIVEILCYEYELFYYWVKCLFLTKNVFLFRRPLYKQEIIPRKDFIR